MPQHTVQQYISALFIFCLRVDPLLSPWASLAIWMPHQTQVVYSISVWGSRLCPYLDNPPGSLSGEASAAGECRSPFMCSLLGFSLFWAPVYLFFLFPSHSRLSRFLLMLWIPSGSDWSDSLASPHGYSRWHLHVYINTYGPALWVRN